MIATAKEFALQSFIVTNDAWYSSDLDLLPRPPKLVMSPSNVRHGHSPHLQDRKQPDETVLLLYDQKSSKGSLRLKSKP